jgi:D-beta-D-heptose 7-phosphate kinase/D-beta-D-heptose 1-phosphate adenosyltransferase
MSLTNAREVVERFGRLKALVIGDLMLDHFIWGSVSRISPEAPVPVVEVLRDSQMPGGAGNVAFNMASLGAEVFLVGIVGQDLAGDQLLGHFPEGKVHTGFCVRTTERPTAVKTRIIAHQQQVVRFDREQKGEPSGTLQQDLWQQIEAVIPQIHCVVLSDYAKGVVTRPLLRKLLPLLRRKKIPVTVDPKPENFALYQRVTCATPNLQEAMGGAGVRSIKTEDDVRELGWKILRKFRLDSVLITRGEKGMSLFERNRPVHDIPTRAREVYDVTGAGDTVISTLTLAIAAGASLRVAAELANYAAGIVVGKLGTASVSTAELQKAIRVGRG